MFDPDAFSERAAIMQYEGGLPRFEAETLAAQAQGVTRQEALNAERGRSASEDRDNSQMAGQPRSHNVPGMQPNTEEEK